MSRHEGMSRIAKVIRGAGWLFIGLGVLVGIYAATSGGGSDPQFVVFAAPIGGAIIGVPLLAVAWVVDGFAK
jgi:hypothetical protein